MSELKSARDIAQERANRLGRLSAEEKEQQDMLAARQAGRALAQKWLDDPQHVDLSAELTKHEEKDRPAIKQATVERLVDGIDLTTAQGTNSLEKIIRGLADLRPDLQARAQEDRKSVV